MRLAKISIRPIGNTVRKRAEISFGRSGTSALKPKAFCGRNRQLDRVLHAPTPQNSFSAYREHPRCKPHNPFRSIRNTMLTLRRPSIRSIKYSFGRSGTESWSIRYESSAYRERFLGRSGTEPTGYRALRANLQSLDRGSNLFNPFNLSIIVWSMKVTGAFFAPLHQSRSCSRSRSRSRIANSSARARSCFMKGLSCASSRLSECREEEGA
mgnify:CR=1 FL=1